MTKFILFLLVLSNVFASPNEPVDLQINEVQVKQQVIEVTTTNVLYYFIVQRSDGSRHRLYMTKAQFKYLTDNQFPTIFITIPRQHKE